jgi:hypothetical protein
MLRTLQAPPPSGSLQEWVLIALIDKTETIDLAKFRALAQLIIDKDKGIEAFEEYMKLAFPGFESRKQAQNADMRKQLKDWTDSGPINVVPLEQPTARSKMKTKLVQVTKDDRAQAFYRKLSQR